MDLMILGSLVLLARVGQALYATGTARSKNAAGATLRSVCDFCVSTLAYVLVGTLVQSSIAGIPVKNLIRDGHVGDVFFLTSVVLIATGAVSAALAERSRFPSLVAPSVLLAALVVPLALRWSWEGWLRRLGFVDAGGAAALHLAAGACALAGALIAGPRAGKYNRDGSASMIPGHSVPLASAGALMIVVGWVAYVAGTATLSRFRLDTDPLHPSTWSSEVAALNALLSAAAGGLAATLVTRLRYGKPDVMLSLAGLMGGLISITAAAPLVGPYAATAIGTVAGVLVPFAAVALDLRGRVDDPGAVVAIHGVGGAWGVLAAGVFGPAGTMTARLRHLGVHALGLVAIAALSLVLSAALFVLLRQFGWLRSKEADEFDGLDLAEHDVAAYPDFQQTTIKSYHLREA